MFGIFNNFVTQTTKVREISDIFKILGVLSDIKRNLSDIIPITLNGKTITKAIKRLAGCNRLRYRMDARQNMS